MAQCDGTSNDKKVLKCRAFTLFSRRSSGVSLIEILIAIVISAILVTLLLGAVGRAKDQALNAKCAATLRQIGNAFLAYAAENNGTFPTMFRGPAPAAEESYWNYTIAPYLGLRSDQGAALNTLLCPAPSKEKFPSYGANYPTVVALDDGQSSASWLDIGSQRLVGKIDQRAFLLADATSAAVYSPLVWPIDSDQDGDGVNDSNGSFPYNRLEFRHNKRANFFLLNGAIVSLTTKEWGQNLNNVWGAPAAP